MAMLAALSLTVLTDATPYEIAMLLALWIMTLLAAVVEHRRTDALILAEREALVRLELERGELKRRNEALIEANRRLEEVTAASAHQLKSGPRVIRGLIDTIREDCPSALTAHGCGQVLAMVDAKATEMLDVVTAIQGMGRLHSANISLRANQLQPLIDSAIQRVRQTRNGAADVDVDPKVWVLTSASLLGESLFNLVDNAWKFNKSPEPRVQVTVHQDDGLVHIAVQDNGIGLHPETPHLFEMFRRHTSEFPGNGMGLAAAKRMVDKAGGELVLLPSETGARFQITLAAACRA